ncbi:hypothetical protein EX30DRAFT_365048 [Ascodesmis nigricans]|uniref:Uncharacterized protein n=1 Tax=Ascodesmis nigricans TaxID=341454 RepID=A0A4S2MTF4_9PEZI|nr:hypothetical protein EX30DRAFT_365048 [Ascodesmis nigricans]
MFIMLPSYAGPGVLGMLLLAGIWKRLTPARTPGRLIDRGCSSIRLIPKLPTEGVETGDLRTGRSSIQYSDDDRSINPCLSITISTSLTRPANSESTSNHRNFTPTLTDLITPAQPPSPHSAPTSLHRRSMTTTVIPICTTPCTHTFPRSPGSGSGCAAVPTRPQCTPSPDQAVQPTKVKAKAKLPTATAMTRISHDTESTRPNRSQRRSGSETLSSQDQNQVQEAVVSSDSASPNRTASSNSSASILIPRTTKTRKRLEMGPEPTLQTAMATTEDQYQHTPTTAAHSFTRTTSPRSSLSLSNSLSLTSPPSHNEEEKSGNETNEKKLRIGRRDLHRAEQARLAAVALLIGVRRGEERARKAASLGDDEVKVKREGMGEGMGERQVRRRRRRERLVDGDGYGAGVGVGAGTWNGNGGSGGGGNGHLIDLSTHRPDWTERDECGPHPGDKSGGGGLGARVGVVWPIVKRVVSAGLRGRESGDSGETGRLREVVRVRDAGSMF